MTEKVTTASRILKVDDSLGLVFGWAMICKDKDGDHYDTQGHHIPQDVMLKASVDYAEHRTGADMHVWDDTGTPIGTGTVPFVFPLTEEICKAMDIKSENYGLLIAYHPSSPEILQKFQSGEYTGFSIGGSGVLEEVND